MKDHSMTENRQAEFERAKAVLDKCIARVSKLAEQAAEESVACCRSDDLDERDQLMTVSAHLTDALGSLRHARAVAGGINGGGMTRSGGT